jgi:hypothetical protein
LYTHPGKIIPIYQHIAFIRTDIYIFNLSKV